MENVGDWLHQLFNIIAKVGPIEVIDVIVVSLILYQLLRLVRGTQALQLLVGLVLLAIVGVVASQLNLILLKWLFQNAAPFIVIAIIAFILDSILGTRMTTASGAQIGIIGILVALASIYFAIALYAKRWHDRNKSGWWTLIDVNCVGTSPRS